MKDIYPTRKEEHGKFITRECPTDYSGEYQGYSNKGFLVIKNYFNMDLIRNLLNADAIGLITNEPNGQGVRSRTGIHKSEPFNKILQDKGLIDTVKNILGSDIYIHQSRINYKSEIGANGWHWHSDFETWHAQDGMPEMRCLTAMIPLTPNTKLNGSLMVIPESHKYFYSCAKSKQVVSSQDNFADQKEGVPPIEAIKEFVKNAENEINLVECEPGDLVLFDCNIIHGSTANITPFPRTNLFFVFNSIENKLVEPFSVDFQRPEEMGTRSIDQIF